MDKPSGEWLVCCDIEQENDKLNNKILNSHQVWK